MIIKRLRVGFVSMFLLLFISNINAQDVSFIVSKIGNQEAISGSRIEVYFSTLNNTRDVEYSSPDIPAFGYVESLSKGDGKIVFEPSLNDVGEYKIKLNAISDIGSATQTFNLKVVGIEASTSIYYIDPVNGNDSNDGSRSHPFKTIDKITDSGFSLAAGSVIFLRSGNFGNMIFSKSNPGMVYVVAEKGQTPMAEKIYFPFSNNWTISGLKITPEAASTMTKTTYVNITGGSKNIVIKNCEIYGTSDMANWPTIKDWYDFSGDGIICSGTSCSFINNNIYNTYFPVQILAKSNDVSFNIINNFGADAVRGLGDYCTFTYNQIKNAVVDDYATGNHDDAFQSWTFGDPVVGIVFRGNQITDISYPDLPLQTSIMQGVVDFDGFAEDWIIENNLIVMHHPHGISLYGAKNCKIVNNTVVKNPFRKYFPTEDPWIRINRTKNGELSYGNLTRNNIMGSSIQDAHPGTFDHNLVTNHYTSVFTDFNNWDFHIKSNVVAYNGGIWEDAPTIDINMFLRDKGLPDMGCFEKGAKIIDDENPSAVDIVNPDEIGVTYTKLSWSKSSDNYGVKFYHVILDDKEFIVDEPRCLLTDLYPESNYTVTIFAEDFAGNLSESIVVHFLTPVEYGQGYESIYVGGVNTDQEITNKNKKEWIYSKYFRVGGIDNITDNAGVLVFKIPPIPAKRKVISAILSVYLEEKVGTPTGNIDLYGLDYKRKSEIAEDVYWQGTYGASNAIGVPLKNDFIKKGSQTGMIETDSFDSAKILGYLNTQIANGAHGNNYLFFRMNSDVDNEQAKSYYLISSSDNYSMFKRPLLKLIIDKTSANDELESKSNVFLFPNPVSSELKIYGFNGKCDFEIYNISGEKIKYGNMNISGSNNSVNIIDLDKGVYYIRIKNINTSVIKRFVKL